MEFENRLLDKKNFNQLLPEVQEVINHDRETFDTIQDLISQGKYRGITFMDFNGTLIPEMPSGNGNIGLLPGVAEALNSIESAGYLIIGLTMMGVKSAIRVANEIKESSNLVNLPVLSSNRLNKVEVYEALEEQLPGFGGNVFVCDNDDSELDGFDVLRMKRQDDNQPGPNIVTIVVTEKVNWQDIATRITTYTKDTK